MKRLGAWALVVFTVKVNVIWNIQYRRHAGGFNNCWQQRKLFGGHECAALVCDLTVDIYHSGYLSQTIKLVIKNWLEAEDATWMNIEASTCFQADLDKSRLLVVSHF